MNLQETLNYYGKDKTPFFFCISYDLQEWEVSPLETISSDIQFSIDFSQDSTTIEVEKESISYAKYQNKFNKIIHHIKNGNTYLANLTAQTRIKSNLSLLEIFQKGSAKYKLFYKNRFVSFSPETFIKIENNKIFAFPMKGTINSNIPNASKKILNNQKELAEHIMIVDLLRNDLNIIAKNVKVEKFRYIDKIKAGKNELLQVSSIISGDLTKNWSEYIGDIIINILPAGSITGTPKKMTVKILNEVEQYDRGYFTGIWGVYDGNSINSAVLIRFIENKNGKFVYKSGGGITLDSICSDEYNEMIEKVYIP